MTVLLIIIAILVSYLVVGFVATRVFLPYLIRSAYRGAEETLRFEDRKKLSVRDERDIRNDVRFNSYVMTFGWPVWVPVTLSHAMSGAALRRYDPNDVSRLQRQLEQAQLRQLERAQPAPDDDDDDDDDDY